LLTDYDKDHSGANTTLRVPFRLCDDEEYHVGLLHYMPVVYAGGNSGGSAYVFTLVDECSPRIIGYDR
jgi:hypothetical protein